MTIDQLNKLEPRKTIVYKKREGKSVQYMFMGINQDGTYQLCGMPYGYKNYLMMDCFDIV